MNKKSKKNVGEAWRVEIMNENKYDLGQLLYEGTEKNLIQLALHYKIRGYSKLSKEALADQIVVSVGSTALEYITFFDEHDIELLEKIIEKNLIFETEEEVGRYKLFVKLGFAVLLKEECGYRLSIGQEVATMYLTYKDDELFKEEQKVKRSFIYYRNALLNMYGTLELYWFQILYNRDHEQKLDFRRIYDMFTWVNEVYGGCKLIQDFIVHESLYCVSEDDFKKLKSSVREKEYFEPSKGLIGHYIRESYYEKTPSVVLLRSYLKQTYTTDEEKLDVVMLLFIITSRASDQSGIPLIEEIMIRWQQVGIAVRGEDEFAKLVNVITKAINDVRRWIHKGHMLSVLTQTPEQKRAEKKQIGRNDLCYCGSGKKYKRCCMNQ